MKIRQGIRRSPAPPAPRERLPPVNAGAEGCGTARGPGRDGAVQTTSVSDSRREKRVAGDAGAPHLQQNHNVDALTRLTQDRMVPRTNLFPSTAAPVPSCTSNNRVMPSLAGESRQTPFRGATISRPALPTSSLPKSTADNTEAPTPVPGSFLPPASPETALIGARRSAKEDVEDAKQGGDAPSEEVRQTISNEELPSVVPTSLVTLSRPNGLAESTVRQPTSFASGLFSVLPPDGRIPRAPRRSPVATVIGGEAGETYSLTSLAIKLQQKISLRARYYKNQSDENPSQVQESVQTMNSQETLDEASSSRLSRHYRSRADIRSLDVMEVQLLETLVNDINDVLQAARTGQEEEEDSNQVIQSPLDEGYTPSSKRGSLLGAESSQRERPNSGDTDDELPPASASVQSASSAGGMSYLSCIQELASSWKEIQLHLADFGEELIGIMLDQKPQYRQCYELIGAPIQGVTLVTMIGKAITVYGHPVKLMKIMHEIGAKHRYYGVGFEHYVVVRNAWQSLLPRYISTRNPNRTFAAWNEFWDLVVELMESGSRNEAGIEWEEKRTGLWISYIRRIWPTLHHRQKNPENILQNTFSEKLYQIASEMIPEKTYYLDKLKNRLKEVNRVFTSVSRVVDVLNNIKTATQAMEELARECKFWMTEDGIQTFRFPFINTCEFFLTHTPVVEDRQSECSGSYQHSTQPESSVASGSMEALESSYGALRPSIPPQDLWNPQVAAALGEFWDYLTLIVFRVLRAEKIPLRHPYAPSESEEGITVIFTDIEGSTALWGKNSRVMSDAVKAHHEVIRNCIGEFKAYEVKTVGDAFLIACKTPIIGLEVALAVQLELMRRPIADGFEMLGNPQAGGTDAPDAWRSDSLRVRIGIHFSKQIAAVYDSTHDHYDYYGPGMNEASRIQGVALGGEIMVSTGYLSELMAMPEYRSLPSSPLLADLFPSPSSRGGSPDSLPKGDYSLDTARVKSPLSGESCAIESATLADLCLWRDAGWHHLKGITEPVHLVSCVHRSLKGRSFFHALEPFSFQGFASNEAV